MAWTVTQGSAIFREWPKSVFGQGQTAAVLPAGPYLGLGADAVKCALFGGNTPDKDATLATTGYNSSTSQWVVANEKTGGGSSAWVTGGRALTAKTFTTPSSGVFMFDDTANLTDAAISTMAGVSGMLVYDDAITAGTGGIAKQGVCFNWFGGDQSVVAGTFSVTFNANGILRITT